MLTCVGCRRQLLLSALVLAALAAFALAPHTGGAVAHSSDAAGDAYSAAIAKAKAKRATKLKACAKKPKAKRAACRKAANAAYANAREKAKEKRDQARQESGSADPGPSSPQEAYHECVKAGGDPRECKEQAKGADGGKPGK